MMRIAWALAAVAGVLVAGAAHAHCPPTAALALAAFDPAVSRNRDDQSAWRMEGLTVMNRTVPYVVVQRHEGRLTLLYYRLCHEASRFDREVAVYRDRLAPDMEARFRSLYPQTADCDETSCMADAEVGYGLGLLESVRVGPDWLEAGDDWTGPAVAQVRADREALDAVSKTAIFLSCTYNSLDRGAWN